MVVVGKEKCWTLSYANDNPSGKRRKGDEGNDEKAGEISR